MTGETFDADFPAIAVPGRSDVTFREAVEEAFMKERGSRQLKDVAAALGVTPSAAKQAFDGVRTQRADTLARFIEAIRSPDLRRSVLDAWERECLGEGLAEEPEAGTDPARRAAALSASGNPDRALAVAREGLAARPADDARWLLFLLATGLAFRLDAPADATAAASELVGWGRESGRPDRAAAGLAIRARAMRRCGFPAGQIQETRAEAVAILASLPRTSADGRVEAAFARDVIESEQVGDVLRAYEWRGGREEDLRKILAIAPRRLRGASSAAARARARQLEAWVHLALRNAFRAEEALAEAFREGGGSFAAGVACGPIQGRILAVRGDVDGAREHYLRLADACERSRHLYLYRLTQNELARLATPDRR